MEVAREVATAVITEVAMGVTVEVAMEVARGAAERPRGVRVLFVCMYCMIERLRDRESVNKKNNTKKRP